MIAARDADELRPGLLSWVAFHPDWEKDVTSVAWSTEDATVLIDPLAPPALREAKRFWQSLDSWVADSGAPVHVLITLHYHRRSAPAVAERYGGTIWVPEGSERRAKLPAARVFSAPAELPGNVKGLPTGRPGEVVFWIGDARAVVVGDVLLGPARRQPLRVCPASWLPRAVNRSEVATRLAPLLELPVELIVPLHGAIVREQPREALAAALAAAAG
jgi:glyoxylase-like metal-dependent hydrolase (beta-lactamase superfamily II)